MKTQFKLFAITMMLLSVSIFAQKKDYSKEPGYIDFGDLSSLEEGKSFTEVIIEEHLLRMVAKLAKHEEPELEKVLSGLKLIKVNSFEVTDKNIDVIKKKFDAVESKLANSKWDRIVFSKSKYERTYVYILTKADELITGLTIGTYETDGEAAFVNIVGDIDLESIGRLSDKFDIPGIEHMGNGRHGRDRDEDDREK
ncbi:MAG: DUF4252 domain-containing protein [Ignavibacteria bacterium]|jgi:hypothetical protein